MKILPKVSVIVTYFKKKKYILRCIKSIHNQNYKNLEILIVYDDENLNDLKYLKNILKKKKIKIVVNKKNIGAGKSRNKAISFAKGKYCAFLDADDKWLKNKLNQQILFMERNKINFSFTNYYKIFQKKKIKVNSDLLEIKYDDLLQNCQIGLSTVILKKRVIPKNLFLNLKTQEDFAAWLKILKKENSAFLLNKTLTNWYDIENSLSKNTFQKMKDAFFIYNKQENFNIFKSLKHVFFLARNSLKRKTII